MNYTYNITHKKLINIKTQTGGNSKHLIMKLWEKIKHLNSFILVALLKESGSKFQYLAVAYLSKTIVVVLGFGKTSTFIPLEL